MTDSTEQKESNARAGASKEEIALELMRFIATTTGFGRSGTAAGFTGKSQKTPEEHVDSLLELYGRCKAAVEK